MILFGAERIPVLRVDKFILNTTQQNPAIVEVNETDDVVLKCRINRQKNLQGLTVRWQHSGSDLSDKIESAETLSNCGCSFDLELKSASRQDAGVYQCVVFAQNGDRLIDSGRQITLVVNGKFSKRVALFRCLTYYASR